jgi:hypothetical protein
VVASEVRSLAQRSAAAAKEIKALIDNSVEKADAGSRLVDQAGTTMREVVESIRRVASLRFAEDLAPDAMAGMTAKDAKGITQVVRLPSDDDPTLSRIERIRERDTAVVDTVNDYYASFHDSMEDSYGSWRQTSFTELEKEMRARSSARTRTVLGAAALIASIFAPNSCSTYDACRINNAMRQAGILAAAGLYALEHHRARLKDDHANARLLADLAGRIDGVRVIEPQTNIVMIDLPPRNADAPGVIAALAKQQILLSQFGPSRVRAVIHMDVDEAGIRAAASALATLLA